MSNDQKKLLEKFYSGFVRKNAEEMIACYHPAMTFTDPIFATLNYADASGMWRMLFGRAQDLKAELVSAEADGSSGRAEWMAEYTFGTTGRTVINRVKSEFKFKDGLIVFQKDDFDLWKWTRMALGAKGALLGWSPLVKNAVRKNAKKGLAAFLRG